MPLSPLAGAAVLHWVPTSPTTIPTFADGKIGEINKSDDDSSQTPPGGIDKQPAPAAVSDDETDIDFTKKLRRKKKNTKGRIYSEDGGQGLEEGRDLTAKQEVEATETCSTSCATSTVSASEALQETGADACGPSQYRYGSLLSRLYHKLQDEHPEHPTVRASTQQRAHKSNVPPPKLARVGGRRVAVCNFGSICSALRRPTTHVQSYVDAELATTSSLDGQAETLTLLGKFTDKHVEQLLRKYIHEYVVCEQCKALETVLCKVQREFLLWCSCCNAEVSRPAINKGFRAVRRGERRTARQES